VACCYVEIKGADGETHFLTTEASSTFDAISQAIEAWGKFWWFAPSENALVRCGDRSWSVSVRAVLAKTVKRY
jgi:hypothetical protein